MPTISKKELQALLAFVSKDETRTNIYGCAAVGEYIYATDGHAALRLAVGEGARGFLSRGMVERVIKLASAKDLIMWDGLEIRIGGELIATAEDDVPSPYGALHRGQIVQWDRDPSGGSQPWAISATLLARIEKLGKAIGREYWIVDAPDPLGPVLFHPRGEGPRGTKACIMPARVE